MNAITKLAEEIREITRAGDRKMRDNRQRFIESEIVEFRPDYDEATEIIDALKTGLALRVGPYGDDLPLEVEHAFEDLKKAMDACNGYQPTGWELDDNSSPED